MSFRLILFLSMFLVSSNIVAYQKMPSISMIDHVWLYDACEAYIFFNEGKANPADIWQFKELHTQATLCQVGMASFIAGWFIQQTELEGCKGFEMWEKFYTDNQLGDRVIRNYIGMGKELVSKTETSAILGMVVRGEYECKAN